MERIDLEARAGVDGDLGVLIATLLDGGREWRENLGNPSPEAVVWQPYPNGPSIGGLILHIASCEWYWLGNFANGEPEPVGNSAIEYDLALDQYGPHWPAPPAQPIEWYFEILAAQRAQTVEMIRAHGNPKRTLPRKDYEVTYEWIVAHLVEHDSYHGGQAVLLHEMRKAMTGIS